MTDQHRTHWLQLKTRLRGVHPAVWRRVRLADDVSVANLHGVIQLLMGWDDDHLHRLALVQTVSSDIVPAIWWL